LLRAGRSLERSDDHAASGLSCDEKIAASVTPRWPSSHGSIQHERSLDGLAADICPVHESYFQFESKKLLAGFFLTLLFITEQQEQGE
jgi:hypothetical protein